tara:strand:- start:640 stop:885 length:246 start_codon:yes stop_codon:yes gene_type:complete
MTDISDRMVFHVSKDETVNNLMVKFSNRAIVSNRKHGDKIHEVEKSTKQWVTEALEEAMDMCVYLQRLLEKIETEEQLNNG